jgi:hypothetical protein
MCLQEAPPALASHLLAVQHFEAQADRSFTLLHQPAGLSDEEPEPSSKWSILPQCSSSTLPWPPRQSPIAA